MSLSKLLALLLTSIFFVIFAVNFIISVNNIRDYLQIESQIHAQDTAISLGLALSPHMGPDAGTMPPTIINAIFDRGYYREIRLVDADGKELVRKTNPKTFQAVPTWFSSWLKMNTGTAEQEISSGWTIAGTVYVTVHPGYGYLKLWQQAKKSFYYSVAAFFVSVAALLAVLRLVLIPLARIRALAGKISEGHFEEIEPLPWTRDLRDVAVSMNRMSQKLRQMIQSLGEKLNLANKALKTDDLSGLCKRGSFESDLERISDEGKSGTVFLARIDDLGGFASRYGDERANELVKAFAQTLERSGSDLAGVETTAYRFYGAEFSIIAQGIQSGQEEEFCRRLTASFSDLGKDFDKQEVAHLGGVAFNPLMTKADILGAAFEAYQKAKLIGANSYYFNFAPEHPLEVDEWHTLVPEIIDSNDFELVLMAAAEGILDVHLGRTQIAEVVAEVSDRQGNPLPIATFVSVAETLGKAQAFDLAVIERTIRLIENNGIDYDLAVNLSFTSVGNLEFRSRLFQLMEQHKASASRLVFAITAYAAEKDCGAFQSFITFIHRLGAKVMLKRYETQHIPMEEIRLYKPDYIRLARDYTDGIHSDDQKRRLVEMLKELGDLLEIKIVAEGVVSDDDFETVRRIGLHAMSR